MTFQDAVFQTEKTIFENQLANKLIVDYGTIKNVYNNDTCDVQLQTLLSYNGNAVQGPLVIKGIEILYFSTSSLAIDSQVQQGDPVLVIGLRRYIDSTNTPMPPPAGPLTPDAYNLSTAKCIPLSSLNNQSGLTVRGKNGKLRVRNATVSLYKVINDLNQALATFANTSSSATTAPQIAAAAAIMVTSLSSVTTEISSLLED